MIDSEYSVLPLIADPTHPGTFPGTKFYQSGDSTEREKLIGSIMPGCVIGGVVSVEMWFHELQACPSPRSLGIIRTKKPYSVGPETSVLGFLISVRARTPLVLVAWSALG